MHASRVVLQRVVVLALLLGMAPSPATAQGVEDVMTTAWEAMWQSTGYPPPVRKWGSPMRVKFSGASTDRIREYAIGQLRLAAEVARVDVSEADDPSSNMEIAIEHGGSATPGDYACWTDYTVQNDVIVRSRVRGNEHSIYRCMLHEAMHVLGFSGHPTHSSVLTFFALGTALTEIDKILLATLYSDDVVPGMSPLAFMAILARRIEAAASDAEKSNVRQATADFLERTIREMEAFASGSGKPPAVLFHFSTASGPDIARGQVAIQFYLGDAYLNGHGVEPDKAKAIQWLTKAAAASHANAQKLLERIAADSKP